MPFVVSNTIIDPFIGRLYVPEVENCPPSVSASVTDILSVHITSSVSPGNYSAIVSPVKASQSHVSVVCSAPNADILVNTKHHRTGECRAILSP